MEGEARVLGWQGGHRGLMLPRASGCLRWIGRTEFIEVSRRDWDCLEGCGRGDDEGGCTASVTAEPGIYKMARGWAGAGLVGVASGELGKAGWKRIEMARGREGYEYPRVGGEMDSAGMRRAGAGTKRGGCRHGTTGT